MTGGWRHRAVLCNIKPQRQTRPMGNSWRTAISRPSIPILGPWHQRRGTRPCLRPSPSQAFLFRLAPGARPGTVVSWSVQAGVFAGHSFDGVVVPHVSLRRIAHPAVGKLVPAQISQERTGGREIAHARSYLVSSRQQHALVEGFGLPGAVIHTQPSSRVALSRKMWNDGYNEQR